MPSRRSSIALFVATTGLIAGLAVSCGKAPESADPQTPAAGQPNSGGGNAVKYHNDNEGGEGGEGGEG